MLSGVREGSSFAVPLENRTLLEEEIVGTCALASSDSSGMDVDMSGSDAGPQTEADSEVVAVSPISLLATLDAPDLDRKLTTRVFFFRDIRWWRPAPRARPVVAEFKLTSDGLDGNEPLSTLDESVKLYVVELP